MGRECHKTIPSQTKSSSQSQNIINKRMANKMEIESAPRFSIVGGDPIALWRYTGRTDIDSKCSLCKQPNRYPCGLCLSGDRPKNKCVAVKGTKCIHVFHRHCFQKRGASAVYEDAYQQLHIKKNCPYGCSKGFREVKTEDYKESVLLQKEGEENSIANATTTTTCTGLAPEEDDVESETDDSDDDDDLDNDSDNETDDDEEEEEPEEEEDPDQEMEEPEMDEEEQ